VLVYACSGTAVSHTHGNIQDHHTVFVTSARLAQKFNDNRTRDDNLRVRVSTRCLHIYFCFAYLQANLLRANHSVMVYWGFSHCRLKRVLLKVELYRASWHYMMKRRVLLLSRLLASIMCTQWIPVILWICPEAHSIMIYVHLAVLRIVLWWAQDVPILFSRIKAFQQLIAR
jgi:hypothetical protein